MEEAILRREIANQNTVIDVEEEIPTPLEIIPDQSDSQQADSQQAEVEGSESHPNIQFKTGEFVILGYSPMNRLIMLVKL